MTVAGIIITSAIDGSNAVLIKNFDSSTVGKLLKDVLIEVKNKNLEFSAELIINELINSEKDISVILRDFHYKTPDNVLYAVDDVWVCNIENETSATIVGYDTEYGNATILRV